MAILGRTPSPELDKRGVRFIRASLDDTVALRRACAGIETVFHTAAKVGVWGHYDDFFRANVVGTRALLAGCREHGVQRLIHTSTPSVVYNGGDLVNANESAPLTTRCPSPYPLTKALAERDVLAATTLDFQTVALRPHLIWGEGDPHLVPRILARARAGRLRRIGDGQNRVDMVHVENAVDAHLLAEAALSSNHTASQTQQSPAAGRAYFITNGEPVILWQWINELLVGLDLPPITRTISLRTALVLGGISEGLWKLLSLRGEPPMTQFVAAELARDHWFDLSAARCDLGYAPRISMAEGMKKLIASLRSAGTR